MIMLAYGKQAPVQRTDATLLVVTDNLGNLMCFIYEPQPGAVTMVRPGDTDFASIAQRLGLGKMVPEITKIKIR